MQFQGIYVFILLVGGFGLRDADISHGEENLWAIFIASPCLGFSHRIFSN